LPLYDLVYWVSAKKKEGACQVKHNQPAKTVTEVIGFTRSNYFFILFYFILFYNKKNIKFDLSSTQYYKTKLKKHLTLKDKKIKNKKDKKYSNGVLR
jgi:hypothetical protein